MNLDQHPNLIALSFAFYEKDTKVEVSVCLLTLNKFLLTDSVLKEYAPNKYENGDAHYLDYPKEKHFSLC